MSRFGGGSTSALLQKVNSKLRGETKPADDDDGLQAYLSGLSKTNKVQSAQKPEFAWDRFGEVSDVSLSEDELVRKSDTGTSASKFLKKKQPEENKAVISKKGGQKSATLSKVSGLSSKYQNKPRHEAVHLSGSDMDLSFSMDGGLVLGDVETLTPAITPRHEKSLSEDSTSFGRKGSKFMKKSSKAEEPHSPVRQASAEKPKTVPQKSTPKQAQPTATQGSKPENVGKNPAQWPSLQSKRTQFAEKPVTFDPDEESSSMSIGKGGSKFMKKKTPAAVVEHKPSPVQSPKEKRKKEEKKPTKEAPKRDMFSLRTSDRYATSVRLDSDEESLQGFIHDLPPSDPSDPSLKTPPKSPKTPRGILKTPRTPHSANTLEDIYEEGNTTLSEDDSFKINVLDLDALDPVGLTPVETKSDTKVKDKQKPGKSKSSKSKPSSSKKKPVKSQSAESDDVFAEMGLFTVDDLLARQIDSDSDHIGTDIEREDDSRASGRSPSPLRSILSPSPKLERTPRSSRTRVHYSLDDLTEPRSPSPEVISTARYSRSASMVYSDDFDETSIRSEIRTEDGSEIESVSEHLGQSQSSYTRSRSRLHGRHRSDSEYYSDDFPSATESRWSAKRREYALSRSESGESEYSAYSDTFSEISQTDTTLPRKSRRGRGREQEVQTGSSLAADLTYRWQREHTAYVSPGYGLNNLDPKLVATHVVSADALEAMTGYSPSVLALNEMLRQQLQLTENYINVQKTLYHSLLQSTQRDYQYTTLEDTKQYIKKHRKPKLTFEEALRQVKREMDLET